MSFFNFFISKTSLIKHFMFPFKFLTFIIIINKKKKKAYICSKGFTHMKIFRYFVCSINTVLFRKGCSRSNAPRHMWKQHQVFLPSRVLLSSCLTIGCHLQGYFLPFDDYISKRQDKEQGVIILLLVAKSMVFLFPILPEVSCGFWKRNLKNASVSTDHCKVHRKRRWNL